MNTICLIRCEPGESRREPYTTGVLVWGFVARQAPLFYPDNDSRNVLSFKFPLSPGLTPTFHSCYRASGLINYNVTSTPGPHDICIFSYLASPGVTLTYQPQDFQFSYEKTETIQEMIDGSIEVETIKLKKKLVLLGENLTETARKELETLFENDFIYVAGLNEGNFYGTLESFSFDRLQGLTGIYSYNLSIKEA